ncbi:MAG: hemolysin family protein [Spirochaetes bacterium]|jgi:putative hemolysin|nr:hemolysin family protein [Spirochaetota bacterium]
MITINPLLLLIILGLGLSAFFSGSETALFSITKSELYNLAFSENRRDNLIASIMKKPRRILITILIGNLISNIFVTTVSTTFLLDTFGEYGHFIAIAVVTPVVIIFCEIVPKIISLSAAVSISKIIIRPLHFFYRVFAPVRTFFLLISNLLISIFNLKIENSSNLSEREIDIAIRLNESQGFIDKEESRFIKNVLKFSKKSAENVMIPRNNAIAISENSSIKDAIRIFKSSGVMRAPVFRENLDTITGIIDSRDLIPYVYGIKKGKSIKRLIRKVNYYPESKELVDLLNAFLKDKIQMAVLIDEYGGTSGIVTLSSIISEVMGESFNLDDSKQKGEIRKIKSVTVVDAEIQIDDFNDKFRTDISSNESETIGGYIIEQLGHIPQKGEYILVEELMLRIRNIRKNKILTVEVKNI